jgi:hypothetical protein
MPTDELAAARARVAATAAQLMVEHPDAPVNWCLFFAAYLEELVHGVPGTPMPRGLLNSEDRPCRS